ncbi:MAG: class I SAM-dependent methyltransferase [Haloferacaceae archaeon]
MSRDGLSDRIADQFSYRGERADVWRAFDRVLDTDRFLNLGYSPWYLPHVVGSSQRRLAARIGADLARRRPGSGSWDGPARLLDVGCGRGGPSIHLADDHAFDVTGIDLVPYNVATAADNAARAGVPATFVVGDATALPFGDDTFAVCTAIDSLVYVPEKPAAFAEIERVLGADGLVAASDLVVRDDPDPSARAAVDAFADAWDMPPIPTTDRYRRALADAGLAVEAVRDVSPNSTGRFRRWTRPYLALADRADGVVDRLLERWDLDAATITEQVRLAHAALPHLRHVIVYARSRP